MKILHGTIWNNTKYIQTKLYLAGKPFKLFNKICTLVYKTLQAIWDVVSLHFFSPKTQVVVEKGQIHLILVGWLVGWKRAKHRVPGCLTFCISERHIRFLTDGEGINFYQIPCATGRTKWARRRCIIVSGKLHFCVCL